MKLLFCILFLLCTITLFLLSFSSPLSLQVHCVGQQGSLASVQSSEEYNFLQSMVILSGQSSAWIGGFYFQVRRSILI